MLDTWHLFLNLSNVEQFSREDLTSRLEAAFPNRPEFNADIYMITPALNNPTFTFTDERTVQFEINQYYYENTFNERKTVQLKAGYWDQNIRTPGDFLPRDGGTHFVDAWAMVDETVDRVYIESWNEYDEGTGTYGGDTGPPYLINNNPNTDVWSNQNDPYEYIHSTYNGASLFNDRPDYDSKVLAHTFPESMPAGTTQTVEVIIRNEGDRYWSNGFGQSFQLVDEFPAVEYTGGKIDDATNEIPLYGGIFRGRPIIFELQIMTPDELGSITTNWQMTYNGEPFGELLTIEIEITEPGGIYNADPASIGLTVSPNPGSGNIRVNWLGKPASRVQLLDQLGRPIASFPDVAPGQNLALKTEKGIYFLVFEIDGYRYVQKIFRV